MLAAREGKGPASISDGAEVKVWKACNTVAPACQKLVVTAVTALHRKWPSPLVSFSLAPVQCCRCTKRSQTTGIRQGVRDDARLLHSFSDNDCYRHHESVMTFACKSESRSVSLMAYLNGIDMPGIFFFSTLFAKLAGSVGAVAGGLAIGKEGPFVHAGACIAALLSQANSGSHELGPCIRLSAQQHQPWVMLGPQRNNISPETKKLPMLLSGHMGEAAASTLWER
eukprot:1159035-Pelagomonas_calceolata.AAC.4